MRRRLSFVLLAAQLAAFVPVWNWGLRRITDPSDEPWCLVALVAALALSLGAPVGSARPVSFATPAMLTFAYALLFPIAPALGRAALALAAVGATLAVMRGDSPLHPARLGLFLLATPLLPTLQFLGGYPLRLASAAVAELLLRLGGVGVSREGTMLRAGDVLVAVDAPCSGVRMLWAAFFLACAACWWLGLRAAPTLACFAATLAAVVLGNGARAAALFYPEAGWLPLPATAHAATGVVAFGLVAAAVLWSAHAFREPTCAR